MSCLLQSLYYHRKNGYLDKTAIRTAIPIGVALAVAGAVAAAYIDTGLLRKLFGGFLLLVGARELFGRYPRDKKDK